MAEIEVLQVPPGSMIVLKGVDLDQNTLSILTETLAHRFGHSAFAILHIPAEGEIEVWTEDDDLAARFTELLAAAAAEPGPDVDEDEPKADPPAPIVGVPGMPGTIELPQTDEQPGAKRVLR